MTPGIEFIKKTNSLFCFRDNEVLQIESWGGDGIRVRATRLPEIKEDWISALLPQEGEQTEIEIDETGASLHNGSIMAKVNWRRVAQGASHSCFIDPGQAL